MVNFHDPVLIGEVQDARLGAQTVLGILKPEEGDSVLDATVGLGGHAEAFAQLIGTTGRITCMDADAENLRFAQSRLEDWSDRCTFVHMNFRSVTTLPLSSFDVIFADLGLSSPHIDDVSRGFSFRCDAPLDLRFDRSRGITAAAFISKATEEELRMVLQDYGEVQMAKTLSRALYGAARRGGVETTFALRKIVEDTCGYRAPAILPQVFQSLRIEVNDELASLDAFLSAAPNLLNLGGRLGIISYHSLEDRRVKNVFRSLAHSERDPVTGAEIGEAPFELLTRKAVVPTAAEQERNPRSRSAKFRAVRKH